MMNRLSLGAFAVSTIVLGMLTSGFGCRRTAAVSPRPEASIDELRPQVIAFCGNCHAFPPPHSFPRDAWHAEVEQGFNFYRESGRTDLVVPSMQEVVAWYRAQAPERWVVPRPLASEPSPLRFQRRAISFAGDEFPAVSHLLWRYREGDDSGVLLFCDMRSGLIGQLADAASSIEVRTLARIPHPAHVTPADLDCDGKLDYLVADLGSYQPEDHQRGRVVWLQPSGPELQDLQPHVLLDRVGRVTDVQPADFDGDGRLDLAVAEFGWRKTGRLLILWGEPPVDRVPRFRVEAIDKRHGVIHVPVADLNGDQRPDVVSLTSQEFETVDVFINQPDATFQRQPLYAAPEPAFGSSGIQLVDFDGDQDLDILYTNGDTLDSFFIKPTHAIHWLENRGSMNFHDHVLANLPGAYRALAGDLDGDGDLDVVACSYLPRSMLHNLSLDERFESLVWLEQRAPGNFVRHSLDVSEYGHVALELGDFDRDGDLDLAVGSYGEQPEANADWLVIWENQGQVNRRTVR